MASSEILPITASREKQQQTRRNFIDFVCKFSHTVAQSLNCSLTLENVSLNSGTVLSTAETFKPLKIHHYYCKLEIDFVS